jgi:hypothetical protein
MHNSLSKSVAIGTLLLAGFAAGPVQADDIIESIKEGLEYYQDGSYSDAVSSLNYAAQLIQQKKSDELAQLLPEPLAGWTGEEADSQSAGTAIFGGGVTANRNYRKDSARIEVQIITDSPMMQGMMMMFNNPMYTGSGGGKLKKIGRQKAMVKYNEQRQRGEITMVVANRFLVTVKGQNASLEDMEAYAKSIDFKKMSRLP